MKANWANYNKLENYLKRKGIDYQKLNEHHYRVLGPVALVDIWPARMTVNVVKTEGTYPAAYMRLDYNFNAKQIDRLLNGQKP